MGRLVVFAYKSDKKLVIGFYGLSILGAFFPILSSYIYKLTIDSIIGSGGIAPTVPLVVIALLGGMYLSNLTWDFVMWGLKNTYFGNLFRNKIQNALSFTLFQKISSLDIAHLENPETNNLVTKTLDTFWRQSNFLQRLADLFNNVVSFAASLLILIPFGWFIPLLISLAALPKLYLRTKYGKIEWSIYDTATPEVKKLWYLRWLMANKNTVAEMHLSQSQKVFLDRFKSLQDHLYNVYKKPVANFIKFAYFPEILQIGVIFIFAYWRLPHVLSGEMSIGTFTFFISILDRVANSVSGMITDLGELYENNLYVDNYYKVINLTPVINEPVSPIAMKLKNQPPRVEFKDVSFAYPGSTNLVLKDTSFIIEPGENVALVGPNGAGKTTIVKLLCRFYDVTSGEIIFNDVNIKDISRRDLYQMLSTLFQEFTHYEFTPRDYILMGSEFHKGRFEEAVEASGAVGFIEKLPDKFDQQLGRQFEGGVELSIGEWQKLAIARAFYEGAPVLILDEPTSAIDAEAEYEIFNNLHKLYKTKTLIFVSHRFSTVRNADKILVVRGGEIIESGTHKALLAQKGVYARMFKLQAKGYVE